MFEKIDIGIKTFLRDEQLFHAVQGMQKNFPGARMVIVDDGDQTEEKDSVYGDLHRDGHITDILPFDSGFGRKSNRIVELSTRPYLLIASDDFEFTKQAAHGLFEMQFLLDNCQIDIVSGRVNGRAYEFDLDISKIGDSFFVKEKTVPVPFDLVPWTVDCDLTVNYSLMRRKVFSHVRWDDDVKIGGGEHGAFFFDCKQADLKTVCCTLANINEQHVRNSPRYRQFRSRASDPARPCFDKRNIVEYVLGDGRVDYRR
jgi:hypothetical protein